MRLTRAEAEVATASRALDTSQRHGAAVEDKAAHAAAALAVADEKVFVLEAELERLGAAHARVEGLEAEVDAHSAEKLAVAQSAQSAVVEAERKRDAIQVS